MRINNVTDNNNSAGGLILTWANKDKDRAIMMIQVRAAMMMMTMKMMNRELQGEQFVSPSNWN